MLLLCSSPGTIKATALVSWPKQFLEINEQNIILVLGGLGMGETHKSIVRIELVYRTIGTMLGLPPH